MDKVYSSGQMEGSTMEDGLKVSNMEQGCTGISTEK